MRQASRLTAHAGGGSRPLRYGVAVASVGAALLLSVLLRALVQENPFLLFFAAVVFSAWFGGAGPALLAIFLSAVAVSYFFIPPLGSLEVNRLGALRLVGFGVVSLLIISMSEARRRAERAAQAQREQLQVTLASIGDAVIATDTEGRITFINAVAAQLTGWPAAEAVGQQIETVFRIVHATTRQEVVSPVREVLRRGAIVGLANHTVLLARDDAERPIDDSGAPIRDARGHVIGVVLVFRDISERERAQAARAALLASEQRARAEAEEAIRLRDIFLSVASHELKTPLTSLLLQAQLLQRRVARAALLPEQDQHTIRVIVEQTRRLDRMIATLLDISRLERGQLSLTIAPVDLCALARRVVAELQPTSERHQIACVAPEPGLVVEGDELRLEQVLQNLLQNAIKYSPAGGPIAVEVTDHGGEVWVSVSDRGIGVPREALPRLFERFYRAPNADPREIGGMGIGLFVVKEIVHLHGGSVRAERREGGGSRFTVSLPTPVTRPVAPPAP